MALESFFEALFLVIFALYQNLKLGLLLFTVAPIIGLLIRNMGKTIKKASEIIHNEMQHVGSMLQEIFSGIREIKIFNTEKFEKSRFQKRLSECFRAVMINIHSESLLIGITESITMIGASFSFYIAISQVLNKTITVGQLTSFIAAIILAYQPLKKLISLYSELQYGSSAAKKIFELLDLKIAKIDTKTISIASPINSIEFKDVYFGYQPEKNILENIQLSIKQGESLGIIGPSGRGKVLCVTFLWVLLIQ
jgi:ABC-type multidrug transport system fused ATPase/permease subunit